MAACVEFFHGSPGSRLQRRVFVGETELRDAGVRMITPDRPGCGLSDFKPGRTVADVTNDIAAIAGHLRLGRFAVLGFSGGTTYGLAVAASGLTVGALGIVSGDAPPGGVPDVPAGLPQSAERHPFVSALVLRLVQVSVRVTPGFTVDRGTAMLSKPDQAVVADPRIRRDFLAMLRDALRQGPRGPLLDLRLGAREWQVEVPPPPVDVHLWHGEADADAPPSIVRYLASRLPGAHVLTYPGEGHVSVFVHHSGDMVRQLAAAAPADKAA